MSAGPAAARREIPVGLSQAGNQVMNDGRYVYAIRFVLDRDTSLTRFIGPFNMEGASSVGGRTSGYARGDGGTIRARLVSVKENGEPDLGRVLAEETVGAAQRYFASKEAFGIDADLRTQLLYFNVGGVRLRANTMYAMTFQNAHPVPAENYFSENSPLVREADAGPNGRNNLDPDAAGAIAGLDAREAVAWSQNGGESWDWGRLAGDGFTPGAYAGSLIDDAGTRLPWYGWQASGTARPQSNQPYYAYAEEGSYTLRSHAVPKPVTLTEAGGYAPVGRSVGVVTVRNTSTGDTGHTDPLGGGIVKGRLNPPVSRQGRRCLRDLEHRHRGQGRSRRLCRSDLRCRYRRLAVRDSRARRRPRGALRATASILRAGAGVRTRRDAARARRARRAARARRTRRASRRLRRSRVVTRAHWRRLP